VLRTFEAIQNWRPDWKKDKNEAVVKIHIFRYGTGQYANTLFPVNVFIEAFYTGPDYRSEPITVEISCDDLVDHKGYNV
jgi:hypothetical protein